MAGKKQVIKHLKGDIKTFKKEAHEDRELMKELKHKKKKDPKHKHKKKAAKSPKGNAKIEKVMHEFKEGKLHSGSKKGPQVTNPKQAIAIAISESKRKKKQNNGSTQNDKKISPRIRHSFINLWRADGVRV